MIALVMVFGLLCNTSLWAGNGKGAGDGSMLYVDLTTPTIIAGFVTDAGIAGSGLTVNDANLGLTTVYGMGPLGYWDSLGVFKPVVGDEVEIAAVLVAFSDGERWIALSLSVGGDVVLLRTDDGPAWRGTGDGTGTCPLAAE